MFLQRLLCVIGAFLCATFAAATLPDGAVELTSGWRLQDATTVAAKPETVASGGFDDSAWLPAIVPGTVLTSYVAAGKVPDPFFGDQMSEIPDEVFSHRDYWYRATFTVPENYAERRVWLNFDGINWKADVYLNGARLGAIEGAFIRGRFEITPRAKIGAKNHLAVLVHRVAHPGPGPTKVQHKKLGSPTTNGDILGYDSPTFVASAGWNWLPIIRGRDIGIWSHVWLHATGDVVLRDPWVSTESLAPDHSRAELAVHAELKNASATDRSVNLVGRIGDATFTYPVTLKGGESREVRLDAVTVPALALAHPRLWWPNGYGEPALSTLELRVEQGGHVTDARRVPFGVRTIEFKIDHNVLHFWVNGHPILCRGGNWGMDEGMLRCDAAGYDVRVRLHRDAGLNMIRNWVGMVGGMEFYDACDRYGILVWDDFWLANPDNGPDPTDNALFLANARDKVRRVRSHPSLALYCGRNEGYPPAKLDIGMKDAVVTLDGTRLYIPHSAAGLATGFGPYDVRDVDWYFAHTGRTLHSELGIVAVPPVESMRAMMPAESLWPINDLWAVHDYQTPRAPLYTKRIEQRYGAASGIEDYCRKAQLVNLESAKAMYEALRANRGSGTLVWMTQSAWPSLICQLYDYWFEPTGAFFGAKTACEPLHVFWNADTNAIAVANDTITDAGELEVTAVKLDLSGRRTWEQRATTSVPAHAVRQCFDLETPSGAAPFFIQLQLRRGGAVVSRNFYWTVARGGSCVALATLPPARLRTSVVQLASAPHATPRLEVTLENPGTAVALAIRLQVVRAQSGARALPVYYDDNYLSLVPGETRSIEIEVPAGSLGGETPRVLVSGWNIAPDSLTPR